MTRARRSIRFSDEEWNTLQRSAQVEGLTVSAYLRKCMFDATPTRPGRQPEPATSKLPAKLRRVQQLAKSENVREPLSVHVSFRVTPSDWELICRRAETISISARRYIRFAALGARLSGYLRSESVRQLVNAANDVHKLKRYAEENHALPHCRLLEDSLTTLQAAITVLLDSPRYRRKRPPTSMRGARE